MWYRIKKAQFGGGVVKATPLLPVSSGQIDQELQEELKDSPEFKNYDEINEDLISILEEMGQTLQDYYEMSMEQQKELWELLIKRPHQVVDQEASKRNRLKSPYHDSYITIEQALEASRDSAINVDPINKQSSEVGNGILLQTGIGTPSFFASSKSNPLFDGDLPSARTLI